VPPEYRDPTLRRLSQAAQDNAADVGSSLDLADALFDLLGGLYAQIDALNTRADAAPRTHAQADIDDLQRRLH
jgi:NAD-specific glutamate dehydrogenase